MSEQGERADSQASAVGAEREAVAREIGARLAEARAAQRLSVEDVSARLKVAAGKLTALEAGHLEALPDVIFAKGVMRAYARMLHVDIDPLLARFQPRPEPTVELVARSDGGLNQSFDERRRFASRGASASRSAGGRWVWLALVVVVIAAGAYFGFDHARQWFEARKDAMSAPHVDEPAPPQSDAAAGTVTAALPPVMSGADSPAPSEDTSAASAPAAAPAPVASAPKAPAAAAPASAPAAATAAPAATAANAGVPAVAPASAAPAPAGAGELQIRFAADTWYEIRDRRGKVVLGGTAKAGQEVSGGGEAPYKVVIGNVKGIGSMTRNGTPVDLQAANRNNVARLTLP